MERPTAECYSTSHRTTNCPLSAYPLFPAGAYHATRKRDNSPACYPGHNFGPFKRDVGFIRKPIEEIMTSNIAKPLFPSHVLKFVTPTLSLRKHIAASSLSQGTTISGSEKRSKRAWKTLYLHGYYLVSRPHCAFL